ncbi:MAG: response regulator [Opitutaceae bacterium]
MKGNPIRVMLVDDHFVVRLGLKSLIGKQPDMHIVAEAVDGASALAHCARHLPDIVLMDIRMPGMSGVDVTSAMLKQCPTARVIVLTTYEGDEDIHWALSAGAKAYFLKTVAGPQLLAAIRAIHAGDYRLPPEVAERSARHCSSRQLSPREHDVLQLIVHGRSNKEIAAALELSENTVKNYIKMMLDKLGVADRTQAATTALRRGLVHFE